MSALSPRFRVWRWFVIGCLFLAAGRVSAQELMPYSSEQALRLALDRLTQEGGVFKDTGALPRPEPDFALTFRYSIDDPHLLDAVTRPTHDDPVVDAYVRWQLLSFAPDFTQLDDDRFLALLDDLPRLAPDPTLNPALYEQLDRLAGLPAPEARDFAAAETLWRKTEGEIRYVGLINVPTLSFRDRLHDALPETGPRRLQLRFCDLRDRIDAGHSTRAIKMRISAELESRVSDDTISMNQRWRLIDFLETMRSRSTRIITDLRLETDEAGRRLIKVSRSTLSVRDADVEKWSAWLNRHQPQG